MASLKLPPGSPRLIITPVGVGAPPCAGKPVVSLERLAALYPAADPRDVMQHLWDCTGTMPDGLVVVFIPGIAHEARTDSMTEQPILSNT